MNNINSNQTGGNHSVATHLHPAETAMFRSWNALQRNRLSKILMACGIALAGAASFGVHAQTAVTKTQTSQQQQNFTKLMAEAEVARKYPDLVVGSVAYKDQLALTTKEVQDSRKSGMGWGQIANAAGLNWGKIVSESKQNKHATGEKRADKKSQSHSKSDVDVRTSGGSANSGGKGGNGGGNSGGNGGGGGKK